MSSLPIEPWRAVRERLDGAMAPAEAVRWLRDAPCATALIGAWAGGGALITDAPVWIAAADEDPFALLDQVGHHGGEDVVGGGLFGFLGFGLGRRLEPVPPAPPRPAPLPEFHLAWHDHCVRCDAEGRWWFEALWTDGRARELEAARERWRVRLAGPPPPLVPFAAPPLRPVAPGAAGHVAAVTAARERIAAGEIFQANLCLRLESALDGDALDLFSRAAGELEPAYAAFVQGPWGQLSSLSPELFLRRRTRTVITEPIKGTAARTGDDDAGAQRLAASAKDRAENVMIADLMRNDLGRVCEYGSVVVDELAAPRPAPGVWHLVSTVRGTLRGDAGDGALLRATFPPGSVTGAPKVQALRVIHELEGTGREAYCGAIGLCSPVWGLELNVAIRTFEHRDRRLWLGAGGGVVADSDPAAELREALDKAAPLAAAAGIGLAARPGATRPVVHARPATERADRPEPAAGLLETILVAHGFAVGLPAHLHRLARAAAELGWPVPGGDVAVRVAAAAREAGDGRVRVVHRPAGTDVTAGPPAPAGAVALEPVTLPGGLGALKWADRRLVDAWTGPGHAPLFVDLDGATLEAGHAAVLALRGDTLVAPPLDGRVLPSLSRARVLDAAPSAGLTPVIAPLTLGELRTAGAIVLTSALRGPHPGVLDGGPPEEVSAALCERLGRAYR